MSTSSVVSRAVVAGRKAGVTVQPWGSDMVRLSGSGRIMSAADAIRYGIADAVWRAAR